MTRILLTGAAGQLGGHLRAHFLAAGRDVLATDRVQPANAAPLTLVDLRDFAQVDAAMGQGVSSVVHFGAVATEAQWQPILETNIAGTYNVFESMRKRGIGRIVFASTYHAVGMTPLEQLPVTPDAPPRPDTLYGVSKLFGENLARLYHDKFGIECLCIRICIANALKDERELRLYCNRDDLAALALAGIDAGQLGYRVAYGISDNPGAWCVNPQDGGLDWAPRHGSSTLAPPDEHGWPPMNPAHQWLGGRFSLRGHPDDPPP